MSYFSSFKFSSISIKASTKVNSEEILASTSLGISIATPSELTTNLHGQWIDDECGDDPEIRPDNSGGCTNATWKSASAAPKGHMVVFGGLGGSKDTGGVKREDHELPDWSRSEGNTYNFTTGIWINSEGENFLN